MRAGDREVVGMLRVHAVHHRCDQAVEHVVAEALADEGAERRRHCVPPGRASSSTARSGGGTADDPHDIRSQRIGRDAEERRRGQRHRLAGHGLQPRRSGRGSDDVVGEPELGEQGCDDPAADGEALGAGIQGEPAHLVPRDGSAEAIGCLEQRHRRARRREPARDHEPCDAAPDDGEATARVGLSHARGRTPRCA